MDDALVERVARAICHAYYKRCGYDVTLDDVVKINWPQYVSEARAAIAAIVPDGWQIVPKEPDVDMCIAARLPANMGAAPIYRAMLAAAPKVETKDD